MNSKLIRFVDIKGNIHYIRKEHLIGIHQYKSNSDSHYYIQTTGIKDDSDYEINSTEYLTIKGELENDN